MKKINKSMYAYPNLLNQILAIFICQLYLNKPLKSETI